jgi:hypothetical protein
MGLGRGGVLLRGRGRGLEGREVLGSWGFKSMFLGGCKALGALFIEQGASLLPASPQGKDNVRSSRLTGGVGEALSKNDQGSATQY